MRVRLTITGLTLAVVVYGLAVNAGADTVYMKNGRSIDSSSVRVDGDRVVVRLFQGEVAFPLDQVERIVENDEVERPKSLTGSADPAPAQESAPDDPSADDPQTVGSGDPGDVSVDDPAAGSDEPPAPAAEQTPEYWQNRLRPLRDQLDGMETQLQALRSRNGADVEAQIGRIEAQRAQVQSQIDSITREARRLNVPRGWLR